MWSHTCHSNVWIRRGSIVSCLLTLATPYALGPRYYSSAGGHMLSHDPQPPSDQGYS
ncbi:hypothetical protein SERLA73DRAFT_186708 [Serpula lacrymans var. lacrymans S7.3]|uniref:Uncharacterized protein n=1 Tax=Serpula lacrymans var. lacrymans (strain S7.3) TaxID=936435 RepID=F8Q7R5_SERL3|nr:hypothetical protein SERLA73DRAFT_186708 [Serpula lacrymans var. lacrymans S7.3]